MLSTSLDSRYDSRVGETRRTRARALAHKASVRNWARIIPRAVEGRLAAAASAPRRAAQREWTQDKEYKGATRQVDKELEGDGVILG